MKKLITWLVLTPLALALAVFAFLNRQMVPVALDPTGGDIAWLRFQAPLYVLMLASGAVGVVAGGLVTWFGQGRHRRQARAAKSEATRLGAEMERLRNAPPALASPSRGAA
jgi:uncharacterized integral membrane protein